MLMAGIAVGLVDLEVGDAGLEIVELACPSCQIRAGDDRDRQRRRGSVSVGGGVAVTMMSLPPPARGTSVDLQHGASQQGDQRLEIFMSCSSAVSGGREEPSPTRAPAGFLASSSI